MRLVHAKTAERTAVALFDGDTLTDLIVERTGGVKSGAVYMARVLKGAENGAFVSLGREAAFFDYQRAFVSVDGDRITRRPTEGERLIVQGICPARDDKGAEVGTDVSVPADFFVWTPAREGFSFSRKIDPADKERLTAFLTEEGVSSPLTVRTAAADADEAVLREDLDALRRVRNKILSERGPLLWEPPATVYLTAEKYAPAEIETDDAQTALTLKARFPQTKLSLEPLWEKENFPLLIEEALAPRSALPCGGSLITERTAAAVCFDVNAGGASCAAANAEAAAEIARQIRIKGLSGQMIVDFAGEKKPAVIKELGRKIGRLCPEANIRGVSTLGLLEMTVRRVRPALCETEGEKQ